MFGDPMMDPMAGGDDAMNAAALEQALGGGPAPAPAGGGQGVLCPYCKLNVDPATGVPVEPVGPPPGAETLPMV